MTENVWTFLFRFSKQLSIKEGFASKYLLMTKL